MKVSVPIHCQSYPIAHDVSSAATWSLELSQCVCTYERKNSNHTTIPFGSHDFVCGWDISCEPVAAVWLALFSKPERKEHTCDAANSTRKGKYPSSRSASQEQKEQVCV